MTKNISKTFLLIAFAVCICCVLYPGLLWGIGKLCFPFQAGGSVLYGPDKKPIGSVLIAQPFTQDQYFQPRPSAASYNAAASASAALAASNYALRSRVAIVLGPIVKYKSGPRAGQLQGRTSNAGSKKIRLRERLRLWPNGLRTIMDWRKPGSPAIQAMCNM